MLPQIAFRLLNLGEASWTPSRLDQPSSFDSVLRAPQPCRSHQLLAQCGLKAANAVASSPIEYDLVLCAALQYAPAAAGPMLRGRHAAEVGRFQSGCAFGPDRPDQPECLGDTAGPGVAVAWEDPVRG